MKKKKLVIIILLLLIIILFCSYYIYDWKIFKDFTFLNKAKKYDDLKLEIRIDKLYGEEVFSTTDQNIINQFITLTNEFEVKQNKIHDHAEGYKITIYNDNIYLDFSVEGNYIIIKNDFYKVKAIGKSRNYIYSKISEFIDKNKTL